MEACAPEAVPIARRIGLGAGVERGLIGDDLVHKSDLARPLRAEQEGGA